MWKEIPFGRYDEHYGVAGPSFETTYGFLVWLPTGTRICKVSRIIRPTFGAYIKHNGRYYEGPPLTVPEFSAVDVEQVLRR